MNGCHAEEILKPQKLSKTKVEFLENLDLLSIEKNRQIEVCTTGQCCNKQWHLCRKGIITASKAHEDEKS